MSVLPLGLIFVPFCSFFSMSNLSSNQNPEGHEKISLDLKEEASSLTIEALIMPKRRRRNLPKAIVVVDVQDNNDNESLNSKKEGAKAKKENTKAK